MIDIRQTRKLTPVYGLAVLLSGGILAAVTVQSAEARQSTRSFTCSGVQDYIQRRGAAVMDTKSRHTYRRFVANRSYCTSFEIIETRTVPTKTGGCSLRICWEPLSKSGRFRNRF